MTLRSCFFRDISFTTGTYPSLFSFYGNATVNFFSCCFKSLSGGIGSPLFNHNSTNYKYLTFIGCEFDNLIAGSGYSVLHLDMTALTSSFIFKDNVIKNIDAAVGQTVNGTFLRISQAYNAITFSGNSFENISGKSAGGALSFEITKAVEIDSCKFIFFIFYFN
jgi:hypothetical protein